MSIADRDYFNLDKKHNEDRLKTYSIPGVQEVIYSDEWVSKPIKKIIKFPKNKWLHQGIINKIWILYNNIFHK